MLLFVGLGNPGSRYAGNRHNIGFMVVDAIARRQGITPWRRRFQGVSAEGPLGGERILLLLPGTYMNESGRAVAEAAHFYKLGVGDIVVFHDEIDLAPGKVRVKLGLDGGRVVNVAPEYADCARLASATGRPLKDVMARAQAAALAVLDAEGGAPGES